MQESDIRFLKMKCNMLIEKALQLEEEKKENALKICQLKEEKESLSEELRNRQHSGEKVPEQSYFDEMVENPRIDIEEQKVLPSEQVMAMIQNVNIQTEEENKVISQSGRFESLLTKIVKGIYKGHKGKKEQTLQEESDKEYLDLQKQEVIIIYEDKTGQKIVRLMLLFASLAVIGLGIYGLLYILSI